MRIPNDLNERERAALSSAVSALYFGDGSDFHSYLSDVVKAFVPNAKVLGDIDQLYG